jgi:two-component system sensor histidine kinase AgrC
MEQYVKILGTIVIIYISVINLTSIKLKGKEVFLMIALAEVISSFLFRGIEFPVMIPIVIIPIIFIYMKSKSVVISIAIPIGSIIIVVISDYIIGIISIIIFGVDVNVIRDNTKMYWQIVICECILVFGISKLIGTIINKKIKILNLIAKGKFGLLIIVSLILTITIFYTNIIFESKYGAGNEIIKINGLLFFLYFILLMIIMYVLIRTITKELEFKNKQSLIENLQQYTDNLEKLNTEMRGFRHDYVNILASIIGFIENDDIGGLKKHFHKNIMPLSATMEANNYKMVLLKNIVIPEIKGIFSVKILKAQELGIDVVIDIMEAIDEINMEIIDLSRVVGILLDNAIEAAEKCDKPYVKVGLINKENSILIVITNTCSNDVPSVHKLYEKGFSTKGENRGIGLSNLKELTEKYTNVTLDTMIEDAEFKQYLEIIKK